MTMTRPLPLDEVGGARAARAFRSRGRTVLKGEEIPLDELRGWPHGNRLALVEQGYVTLYPKQVAFVRPGAPPAAEPAEPADEEDARRRIVVPRGFGKFDVIEGVVLAAGVTKDEASAIAGVPPEAQPPPSSSKHRKPVFRKDNPASRARATAPAPKMPADVAPRDDEPNGPVD